MNDADDGRQFAMILDQAYAETAGLMLALTLRRIAATHAQTAERICAFLEDALDIAFADDHPLASQAVACMIADDVEDRMALLEAFFGDGADRAVAYGPNGAN